MNDAIIKGNNAQIAKDIVGETLKGIRATYMDRIVQIAGQELDSKVRADKLANLSMAVRIVDNIEQGIVAMIEDGKQVEREMIRAETIERMSPERRRLFSIAPR